jgi:hypothetical protein
MPNTLKLFLRQDNRTQLKNVDEGSGVRKQSTDNRKQRTEDKWQKLEDETPCLSSDI